MFEQKENGKTGYGTTLHKAKHALKYAIKTDIESISFKDLPDPEKITFWNMGG